MNANFVAACLISDNNLHAAWEAAGVAARKCNGGLDTLPGNEELHARSRAREETMCRAHSALEKLGLRLPYSTRTQAEVFTDFNGKWGEDPFNGFCWSIAETALKARETRMIEQELEWVETAKAMEEAAIEQANSFKRVHA